MDGRTAPRIQCDYCHEFIDDAASACVLWVKGDDGCPTTGYFFAHKVPCSYALEAAGGGSGRPWPWEELTTFLARVAHNCRCDTVRAQRT
jgi:hypothetical protein